MNWILNKRRARVTKKEMNTTAFNQINNVHEKITRFWIPENDCILM